MPKGTAELETGSSRSRRGDAEALANTVRIHQVHHQPWAVRFAGGSSEHRLHWRIASFRGEGGVDTAAAEAIQSDLT